MRRPKVTVLMPVYDCEAYLGEALASILGQTHRDFELLAIDDGSGDRSSEILATCRDPRLRVHRHGENRGIVATLNEGLELACGEYVARMDADDIAFPERLALQVSYLQANPEVAAVGGDVTNIGSNTSTWHVPRDPAAVRARLFFSNPLAHAAVMLRPDVLRREGLRYDASYPHAEDYALWVALAQRAEIANLPETLLRVRVHTGSTTHRNRAVQRGTVRRIRAEQLARIGIAASEFDLVLHDAIADGLVPDSIEFVDDADAWLRRLLVAGRALGPAGEAALAKEVAFRWARVCRRSRRLGLAALRRFRASPLHREAPPRMKGESEVFFGAVAGALGLDVGRHSGIDHPGDAPIPGPSDGARGEGGAASGSTLRSNGDVSHRPLVSVIIPTYQRVAVLGEAIRSALDQTYDRIEVLVEDDGSTDGSDALVASFADPRVRYAWAPNVGYPAPVRNRAIRKSNGSLIAFLDSDDVWEKDKLECQVEVLVRHPDLLAVSSKADSIPPRSGRRISVGPDIRPSFEEVARRGLILNSGSVVRREVLDQVGFLDEDPEIIEDLDLWLRILRHREHSIRILNARLFRYRKSPDAISSQGRRELERIRRIFDKHMDFRPDVMRAAMAEREEALVRRELQGALRDGTLSMGEWLRASMVPLRRRLRLAAKAMLLGRERT